MSSAFSKLKLARPTRHSHIDAGSPTRVIFTTLAIFIISQFVAAFIVETALAVFRGSQNISLFDQSTAAQFFYVVCAEALAVGFLLLVLKARKIRLGYIGLWRRPTFGDLKRAILGLAVFYLLIVAASLILELFIPGFNTDQKQQLGFNNLASSSDHFLAFLALVILPPLGEEPLVRGYLYSGLRSRWSFGKAMIVTSLFFGLAHLEVGSGSPLVWGAAIDTFLLSLVLVYLREKTGALYAGMLVHMANNLIAFGVHFHF